MFPYTIDDEILNSLKDVVDVTIDFGNGRKRWCFFITPQQLATNGDLVKGTTIPWHLGVPHMIVVGEVTETIIEKVLNELFERRLLEEHTTPLI